MPKLPQQIQVALVPQPVRDVIFVEVIILMVFAKCLVVPKCKSQLHEKSRKATVLQQLFCLILTIKGGDRIMVKHQEVDLNNINIR